MVDPYDEEMRKRALSEWSSSKYATLEGTPIMFEDVLRGVDDLDRYFSNRAKNVSEDKVEKLDLDDHWEQDGLHVPDGYGDFAVISRAELPYPVGDFRIIVPDYTGDKEVDLGLEAGSSNMPYHCKLTTAIGDNAILEAKKRGGETTQITINSLMPGDYDTARNQYTFKRDKSMQKLYINGELRAVMIFGMGVSTVVNDNTLPYSIGLFPYTFNSHVPLTFRAFNPEGPWIYQVGHPAPDGTGDAPFDAKPGMQFHAGVPLPAETYQLYDWEADTLLTSGTYDSGVSHKSHPVPVQGYDDVSIYFRADTDAVTDGLTVEMLTQEGNWRTYATRSPTANDLEVINLAGRMPLSG